MGASKSRQKTGASKRKANSGSFKPGDPRINREGRPPLSQAQREFRQRLHDLEPDVIAAVTTLVQRREPSVVNKLVDQLAGKAPQSIELTGKDGGPVEVTNARDKLAARIADLAAKRPAGAGPPKPE